MSLVLCTLRQILDILEFLMMLQLLTDLRMSPYLKCMYQFHLEQRVSCYPYCALETQVMLN